MQDQSGTGGRGSLEAAALAMGYELASVIYPTTSELKAAPIDDETRNALTQHIENRAKLAAGAMFIILDAIDKRRNAMDENRMAGTPLQIAFT